MLHVNENGNIVETEDDMHTRMEALKEKIDAKLAHSNGIARIQKERDDLLRHLANLLGVDPGLFPDILGFDELDE